MLYKVIGFVAGLSLFSLILYSVFTHTLLGNLSIIVALALLNVLFGFVLPRLLKSSVTEELKSGLMLFGETINRIVVTAALLLSYILGVGFTWLLSRLVGKRFLQMNQRAGESTWIEKGKRKINFDEMF